MLLEFRKRKRWRNDLATATSGFFVDLSDREAEREGERGREREGKRGRSREKRGGEERKGGG